MKGCTKGFYARHFNGDIGRSRFYYDRSLPVSGKSSERIQATSVQT